MQVEVILSSNRHGEVIHLLPLWSSVAMGVVMSYVPVVTVIFVWNMLNMIKYGMSPFYFHAHKRLSTKSFPPDLSSAHSRMPVGTRVPKNMCCERKKDQVEQ
jgi:hypothetical protein